MFTNIKVSPGKLTNQSSQFAFYVLFFIVTLLLTACGGGGTSPSGSTASTPSGGSSISTPAVLAIDTIYSDTIAATATRYYKLTTGNRALAYKIDLQNLSTSYIWRLYSDSGFTTRISSCSQSSDTGDCETSSALSAATTYYLSLTETSISGASDSFTIKLKQLFISEGTLDVPVNLLVGTTFEGTVGEKPYSSRVQSYYQFTTNAVDSTYTISLTGATTDLRWKLYVGDWNTSVRDCDLIWDVSDESCTTVTLTGSTVYFLAVESMTQGAEGTLVSIDVSEGGTNAITTLDEGTVATPVVITLDQLKVGSVSPSGISYYKFTTGDVAAYHQIRIGHRTTRLELRLYSDSAFSNEVDSLLSDYGLRYTDILWSTVALDPNATFYLTVQEAGLLNLGDEYDITVSPNVVRNPDSEGTTITPIDLSLGVPYNGGKVGSGNVSYYKFTLPEAKPFRISLANGTSDLYWSLWHNFGDYSSIVYCNSIAAIGDEICSVSAQDAGSTVYLTVRDSDDIGPATFDLLVETLEGEGEGTFDTPVALTNGTPYVSSVGWYSYYSFTTGAEKMIYRISATGMTSDIEWDIKSPADTGYNNICDRFADNTNEICDTKHLLPDTTYLLRVRNNDSGTNTPVTVLVDTGTPIINLDLNTPLVGETNDGYAYLGYYKFTTDAINTDYTFRASGNLASLDYIVLTIHVDDTYSTSGVIPTCIQTTNVSAPGISCTIKDLTINTTYYLKATTTYGVGIVDIYDLVILTDNFSEGTLLSPVALTTAVDHLGKVQNNSSSYYQFTTAGGGPKLHDITYSGESGVYIWLYNDMFITDIFFCGATLGTRACTTATTLTAGTTYYIEVEDRDNYSGNFTLNVTSQ